MLLSCAEFLVDLCASYSILFEDRLVLPSLGSCMLLLGGYRYIWILLEANGVPWDIQWHYPVFSCSVQFLLQFCTSWNHLVIASGEFTHQCITGHADKIENSLAHNQRRFRRKWGGKIEIGINTVTHVQSTLLTH